jgi:hypothetical protein
MALTGGISFFNRSMCLAADGTTVIASSGDASSSRALDRNPFTYWRTSGSNDTLTETLTVNFTEDKTFNRIFLIDHNFKNFTVEYDVAGVWTDFASVSGINGALANITETNYALDTSYYEFTEVTTGAIRVSIDTTQTANAEKYLNQLIVTSELGTLEGYPEISSVELSRNLRVQKMLSGRVLTQKSDEYFQAELRFRNYPASLSDDIDLAFRLHDLEDNFLVWICGGRQGSTYFRKQMRGYRLKDVIPVQLVKAIEPTYSNSVYVNTVNFNIALQEDVQ